MNIAFANHQYIAAMIAMVSKCNVHLNTIFSILCLVPHPSPNLLGAGLSIFFCLCADSLMGNALYHGHVSKTINVFFLNTARSSISQNMHVMFWTIHANSMAAVLMHIKYEYTAIK